MIGIIDYGAGNLDSVQKAVELLGYEAKIISTNEEINEVDSYILPGVGAFSQAMDALNPIKEALLENIHKGKYILGICLGLQLLFDVSYEDGEFKGLSLIKGEVRRFDDKLKVPHMGWNELIEKESDQLTRGINGYVYFVHSYYACPKDETVVKMYSEYGIDVPALVRCDNVVGMQFHPEKSSKTGMALLKNYLEMIGK